MINIYKVTSAIIGTTKNGYQIYKIQLNNSFWATKLLPLRKNDKKYNTLYNLYIENNKSLDFLINKHVSISLHKTEYGIEFSSIDSFDALKDFEKELDISSGNVFATKLPIYDFLYKKGRPIENDKSIKISSRYGDMRISKADRVNICYPYNDEQDCLKLNNINLIFDKFYKDVSLSAHSTNGDKSYYKVNLEKVGIVRMDNHYKLSYKMTASGDRDEWIPVVIKKIGDKLSEEQIDYLKNNHCVQLSQDKLVTAPPTFDDL
ncbi:MAG: hypothetical protein L3K52_14580 [Candidatus Thiothrix sulfatifontis]|nr:MAG: hypothetical protein L3K52_14580 [Candidatus Thiothrix sulfatifontis]